MQTPAPDPFEPALVTYLHDPQPYKFPGLEQLNKVSLTSSFTARVVSSRPLVLDVVANSGSKSDLFGHACGLVSFALADDRLKDALSKLHFGQDVKATVIFGGTPEYPHEAVLTNLAPPDSSASASTCTSRSGLLLTYRGLVEYVDVYNDGTISYHDPLFQVYDHQKLPAGDLGQLLSSFGDAGFDGVPSITPQIGQPFDRYALALICSRLQGARTADIEGPKFAPLRARLEDLKSRAISQTFYLLLTGSRVRQTILGWPFHDAPLSEIQAPRRYGRAVPPSLSNPVPDDWLARIPKSVAPFANPQDPNASVYFTDAGKLYRVFTQFFCGPSRPCKTFLDLGAFELQSTSVVARPEDPKNSIVGVSLPDGSSIWPSEIPFRLASVPREGARISDAEFEAHRDVYFQLLKAGIYERADVPMIEDGYIYHQVRICRVDPQAPPEKCLHPDAPLH